MQFTRYETAGYRATDGELGTIAMRAVTAMLLSIPGYRIPAGGIKKQLKRYCRVGSSFCNVWRVFNRNHLHLLRSPYAENRFETFLEFSVTAKPTDGLSFLSARDGRRRAEKELPYREPVRHYQMIPNGVLKDSALSYAAKSVVLLALLELELAQRIPGYKASKQAMIDRAGVKVSSFEAAWREAKKSGYIRQERMTGEMGWRYVVAASPEAAAENLRRPIEQTPVRRKRQAPDRRRKQISHQRRKTDADTAKLIRDRRRIEELVKENIGYDWLKQNAMTSPLYYHTEEVDGYVQMLSDAICTSRPRIRIGKQEMPADAVRQALLGLRCEHILYVMERMGQADIKYNPLGYKLTALYNAGTTYREYACSMTA